MSGVELEGFLTHLVVEEHVAASAQNQVLNVVVFSAAFQERAFLCNAFVCKSYIDNVINRPDLKINEELGNNSRRGLRLKCYLMP